MARSRTRLLQRLATLIASHHQFVHPAYQRLASRVLKSERNAQSTESPANKAAKRQPGKLGVLAKRIKQRVLHYTPLARVPPFHCQKCGLSSKKLVVLVNHVCSRKLAAFSEYTNLEKLVRLGFRSKVKDAFAVLERIPNPQSVKISRLPSSLHIHVIDRLKNPLTLVELASKAFESAHLHLETLVAVRISKQTPEQLKATPVEDQTFSEDTLGYYCQICCKLFCRFFDYDKHLSGSEECSRMADPLEIEVATNRPYSKCGHLVVSQEATPNGSDSPSRTQQGIYNCTKCFKSDFLHMEHFHKHIFHCALQNL